VAQADTIAGQCFLTLTAGQPTTAEISAGLRLNACAIRSPLASTPHVH
jgi:hypothetical protein